MEEWKVAKGFSNYEVSTLGRVRNRITWRILKRCYEKDSPYPHVTLYSNKRKSTLRIHRIVSTTFLGEAEGRDSHHKDEDSGNPSLENLEYLTKDEHKKVTKENLREELEGLLPDVPF